MSDAKVTGGNAAVTYLGDFLRWRSAPRRINASAHTAMVQALEALQSGDKTKALELLALVDSPTNRASLTAKPDRFDRQERKRMNEIVRNTRDLLLNEPKPKPDPVNTPDRALSASEVIERVGVSRTTWYALIRRGQAPAGLRVSVGRVVWLESTIVKWLESRPVAGASLQITQG